MEIEEMKDFFIARLNTYDEHMISNFKNIYIKLAELIPSNTKNLLDLGCGTGLELEEIYKKSGKIIVTGIDLTKEMLDKLQEKYTTKNIRLINANYFEYDFGINNYDIVISCETLHHFSHEDKIKLYKKINRTLKECGQYIECDYMVEEQSEEDKYYKENEIIRKENNIKDGEFYHYDTPCTEENQIIMLKEAGFKNVEKIWREESTTVIIAKK